MRTGFHSSINAPRWRSPALSWTRLSFGRQLDDKRVAGFVRSLAGDRRRAPLVLELAANGGHVDYRLGALQARLPGVIEQLHAFCPNVTTETLERALPSTGWAWRLLAATRNRPLRTSQPEVVARSLLAVLATVGAKETIVVQLVLGRRLRPLAIPNRLDSLPSSSWREMATNLVLGPAPGVDSEARRALRDKVSDPGFRAGLRLGISTTSQKRAQRLAADVLTSLRVAEGPGVHLRPARDRYRRLETAGTRRLSLAVNVNEVASLLAWPVGDSDYPGVVRSGAQPLRPTARGERRSERVVADATYPGHHQPLDLSASDALQHLHVIGPTGVGKSTLLLNLIIADIDAGRGVVVIDPKGDLITDVLARIPERRRDEVVVLDPADESRPVGLNPLRREGRVPELVADQVLAVFHGLYRDSWGPRSQDILHASLLTLAGRDDATLCALPVLLSDAGYRRKITAGLTDRVALGPFWSWFESISPAERTQAIAPVMNKLRAFLLRPRMRAVLGQAAPAFDMSSVFTRRRILLVSLGKGLLGPEASALLGSLVVSQLWNAVQSRSSIDARRRHPVMCFIDEFQDYLHLPTDIADVLAQARGLGLGLTLAHQHLAQLQPEIRQAVLANARSRVCFQLSAEDATLLARGTPNLEAEDFRSLGRFEVYASLMAGGQATGFASGRSRAPIAERVKPDAVRRLSRERFGRPLDEIEAELAALTGGQADQTAEVGRRPRRRS